MSFGGGMDAFAPATLLPPDAYQYGENIVVSDNLQPRTRPGADQFIPHTYTGKIQGVFYFDTPSIEALIFANAGNIYTSDSSGNVSVGVIGTLVDADVDFVAAQGVNKIMIVDGTSCITWDGTNAIAFNAVAGSTAFDPPFGATTCVFCAGRMWAAGFSGSGPAGKEDDSVCFSAILDFGTGKWNLTDNAFRVGGGEGDPIRGLAVMPAAVPEQEVLAVLKENSIRIIRVDPTAPDSAGFKSTLAAETLAGGLGVVGKRAFCIFDNDLLYVAPDHSIRSLARMEAAAQQFAVSAPLSLPLQPFIDRINWDHASTIAAVRYKQLALFSVPLDTATTPNTVLVWNGRLQKWIGIFTNWTANSWAITRFSGVQRLIHGDKNGNVRKWKDYADQTDDNTFLDDSVAIPSKLWTRSFLFGEQLNNKTAYAVTGRANPSNAVVTFTLVGDSQELISWTKDLRPTEPNLPIDLPFDLTSDQNTPMPKGLRNQPEFNECYIKVESTAGWWTIRNLSMAAFINSLSMQ